MGILLAGGLALPLAGVPAGRALAGRGETLGLEPLSDRLSRVTGAACNILVLRGDDGLLLVDGGAAADARALSALLEREYRGLPVKVLLNTHWHAANTGFNEAARKAGAEVIAHENTRLWMTTVVNSKWEGRTYEPRPEAARPSKTFYDGVQRLVFSGQTVEYGHLGQAHTDGDIYVKFAAEDVIAAGDVLAPGRWPIVDPASNGWLGGMLGGLRTLASLGGEKTRYVPGAGPVAGRADVQAQEAMALALLKRIGDSYYKGETWEQFLASAPTRDYDAALGDPALFLKQAYDTAWYHVTEIRRVAR